MNPVDRRPARIPETQIWDAARQFFNAYEILYELPPEPEPGVVLPLLNAGAMSLELYLKCLAPETIYRSAGIRGIPDIMEVYAKASTPRHEPVKLWRMISDDIQEQLEGAFQATPLGHQRSSFEEFVSQFEGLLMASRYPFEEKIRRIDGYPPTNRLLGLLRFLDEFAKQLRERQLSP